MRDNDKNVEQALVHVDHTLDNTDQLDCCEEKTKNGSIYGDTSNKAFDNIPNNTSSNTSNNIPNATRNDTSNNLSNNPFSNIPSDTSNITSDTPNDIKHTDTNESINTATATNLTPSTEANIDTNSVQNDTHNTDAQQQYNTIQHDREPYIERLPNCVLVNIFPFFNIIESCSSLMLVCKRWHKLFASQQHIWKMWCELESWYGRISFYAQRNNSSSTYNGETPTQKQQKLDYRERWNRLKESERRWKQGLPISSSIVKNAHETLVVNMGCHNSSYMIYSADRCGHIKTWDVETQTCVSKVDCGQAIKFAQFSDEEVAIVTSAEGMQIWDLKGGACTATLSSSEYNSIVLHDANLLAVSTNMIELWDVATPTRIFEWNIETSILCASLYGNIFVTGAHENICMWDIRTQKCERVIKAGAFDIELNASCVVSCHAFEFAQKRNLSKYWYNLLTVRDLRSENKQEKIVDGGYILYGLEGHKLVSGNDTRRLVDVWDVGGNAGFKNQKPGKLGIEATAACITSRVSKLCVATRNGDIYLYDF